MGKRARARFEAQLLAATQAQTAIAQQAQDFNQKYFQDYVAPLLTKQAGLADQANTREQELFDINKRLTLQAEERYNKYGIPAEDRYFEMVNKYSGEEEQARVAEEALGDAKTAQGVQQADYRRRLGAFGIDPTSPAAVAAMSDMAVNNAAINASAQTRARAAAKTLGMQLTADAANFGRGGAGTVLQFGGAASGNNINGMNIAGSALSGAVGGAGNVNQGYGVASNALGNVSNSWSGMWQTDRSASAQTSGALGAGLGQLAGTAAAFAMFSDRALKKNIVRRGRMSTGIGIYEFNYNWEPEGTPAHIGYMADEVEKVYPDAVFVDPASGYKKVDYAKVVF